MRFAQPEFFYLLWSLPALLVLMNWVERRRRAVLSRFVSQDMAALGISSLDERRRRWTGYFLLLSYFFSIFALARPQWGYEKREIKRQGIDILIVLDTSRSMLTTDVLPNRLERAKLAVRDLLKKLKGDRVGLIAFAGDAFLACPLTVDYGGFMLSLEDISTESIPRGGTNLAAAIQEAMKEYDQTPSQYKAVVVLTDGENLEEDPMPYVEQAKKRGIKIYTVGVGTTAGDLIRVQDMLGRDSYLKDVDGNYVKSRLNETLLKKIAEGTGGAYVHATGVVFGLDVIYDQYLSKMERRAITAQEEKNYYERFQIPLGAAFGFLCLATILSTRKRDERLL